MVLNEIRKEKEGKFLISCAIVIQPNLACEPSSPMISNYSMKAV